MGVFSHPCCGTSIIWTTQKIRVVQGLAAAKRQMSKRGWMSSASSWGCHDWILPHQGDQQHTCSIIPWLWGGGRRINFPCASSHRFCNSAVLRNNFFPSHWRKKAKVVMPELRFAGIHKAQLAIPKAHIGGSSAKLLLDSDKEQPAAAGGTQKPTFLTGLPSFSQVAVAAGAAPVVVVDAEAVGRAHSLVARQVQEACSRGHAAPPRCPHGAPPHCGWRLCDGSSGFRSGCKDPWQEPGTGPWCDFSFDQKFSVASFNSRKWSELKGSKGTPIQ